MRDWGIAAKVEDGLIADGALGACALSRGVTGSQIVAIAIALPIALVLVSLAVPLLLLQGRPLFHGSERLGLNGAPFTLWKLRTMTACDATERVLGGDGACRVTGVGRILRRTRLDELPQILNVVRGDVRFIGPRPPLARYACIRPSQHIVLQGIPPGITGLATVQLCGREERILGAAMSEAEVENLYLRRCLPAKARLDRLYRDRATPWLALYVIVMTFWRNPAGGRRLRRAFRIILRAWRA